MSMGSALRLKNTTDSVLQFIGSDGKFQGFCDERSFICLAGKSIKFSPVTLPPNLRPIPLEVLITRDIKNLADPNCRKGRRRKIWSDNQMQGENMFSWGLRPWCF